MIKPRAIFEQIKPYFDSPEAIVITGMRRTGKTTVLNWIYGQVVSPNKLYLDLENPLNRKYFEAENYEMIKATLEFLGLDFHQKVYLFLDEIQFSRNLPSVVKYFIDRYHVKFFLTGSASFYLKNLFTESLAGRKYIFELFPLTFREFLVFKDSSFVIPEHLAIDERLYATILPLYEEYLRFGGFPGVVLKKTVDEKKKALDEIFTSFYQLEVIQLADFRKNEVIRDLILLLAQRIGEKLDTQRISKELGVARITLKEYLSFLEGTYFIKLIPPFSLGRDVEIRKAPKIFLSDCGLANHLARLDPGRIFENSVFQILRTKGELHYYQKKSGQEIDFILNKKIAYEAKIRPSPAEVSRLNRLRKELGLEEGKVVSKEYCQLEGVVFGFTL